MKNGIVIVGGNGSGKTTLGRMAADKLNLYRMDVEDYYFKDSALPYSSSRSANEVQAMMLADIRRHGSFVLSSVKGDWGSEINACYGLAVYLHAPLEVRMQRIRQRAFQQFGSRVLPGGDLYEQEERFFAAAASKDISAIETWLKTLPCPVLMLDAMLPPEDNLERIIGAWLTLPER